MQYEYQHVKDVRLYNTEKSVEDFDKKVGRILADLTDLLDPCDEFDGYDEEEAQKLSEELGIERDEHFTVRYSGEGYVLITLSPRFLTRDDLAEMFPELKVDKCYDTFVNENGEVEEM
jgi:hypothetical protein